MWRCVIAGKAERVTRFDEALFKTAAAEGSRQSRSARQQLEHWARLGAALSAQVESPVNRVRLALEGTIAQRDLTLDEARQFDAAIAVRIDDAVAGSDFSAVPVPDFAAVSPDPHRVLADLADLPASAQVGQRARDQLREALSDLAQALDAEQPAKAGR
ncbi:ParD-like family protein [Nocardioides sp. cx-173]|uniref:ParD-like family protein n=1 Tax=Nocardioides sp. cx-173 TaxID=2898796 RepID=UPI001E398506|nr:ParD-like family protein [Nocardioides sp. cx-173]MCD4527116.1 ParD-like family protein [Nocardioides sp. cx-173]UGB42479.1 ParD-like family protein [Nocardioides sp. cx-173]